MIKAINRVSAMVFIALAVTILSSCPLLVIVGLGLIVDQKAAEEAKMTLGTLELAISYEPLEGGYSPSAVAYSSNTEAEDLSRLKLVIDGASINLGTASYAALDPVAAGTVQDVSLYWDWSLIWKGQVIARPIPEGLSCDPDFSAWVAARDTTLAVSWSPIAGVSSYECLIVGPEDNSTTFPFDYNEIIVGTAATIWWTQLDALAIGTMPRVRVRSMEEIPIGSGESSWGWYLRVFGAAGYIASSAGKGS